MMFLFEVPKHWQLAACSDTLFYLLCRRSMDQFIKLLPDGKSLKIVPLRFQICQQDH